MSTAKKYISKLFLKHSTFVILPDGRKANLEFTGGIYNGSYKRGGYIIVTDPEVQQAIESDSRFKIEFSLAQTFAEDVPLAKQPTIKIDKIKTVVEVEEPIEETTTEEEVEEPIEEVEVDSDYKIEESITDVQLARNYFRDLGEAGLTPVLSKQKITALCEKYKVAFPNLK